MFSISYSFYTTEYGGEIPELAFNRLQRRAGIILDRLTFGSIKEQDGTYGQIIHGAFVAFNEDEITALSYAICILAENINQLDILQKQVLSGNTSDANIKSRSSGGESISYETKKSLWDDALYDEGKKLELFRNNVFSVCDPFIFRYNPFYAGLESRW